MGQTRSSGRIGSDRIQPNTGRSELSNDISFHLKSAHSWNKSFFQTQRGRSMPTATGLLYKTENEELKQWDS
jgi:hypothetical protein